MSSIEFLASQYSKIFWFESIRRNEKEQARYHIYGVYHYEVSPDFYRLEYALQAAVNNNYNLRSNFIDRKAELLQIIHDDVKVVLNKYSVNNEIEYQKILKECIELPFNLADGPLFRFSYIDNKTTGIVTFVPNFHHIIMDGTQYDELMQTIAYHYHHHPDLTQTDNNEIQKLQAYIKWEQKQINTADVYYWVEKFKNYPLAIDLPLQHTIPDSNQAYEVAQLYHLKNELYERLTLFSQQSNCSVFDILKSVLALLVSQYSNQSKVIIAYPFNTRRKEHKCVKGAFLNTWLYGFNRDSTFTACLNEQKNDRRYARHRYANIIDIADQLQSITFSVSISQAELLIEGPILEIVPSYTFKIGLGSSDLCLFFNTKHNNLQYGWVASAKLFDEKALSQFNDYFCQLLESIIETPGADMMRLSCLSADEYHRIVYQWNLTGKKSPDFKTICQVFETQAAKTPNHTAILFQGLEISFRTLDERANRLAWYIRKEYQSVTNNPLNPDTLIPICMERGFDLITGILAILKAGAAYVPIDPTHPDNRIRWILEDINAQLVVTTSDFLSKINKICPNHKEILVDKNLFSHESSDPVSLSICSNDLAYVIYTSGTTGKPKGVMIQHSNVTSLVCDVSYFTADMQDTFALFSDITFDAATFEIWGALLNGARLFIPDDRLELLSNSTQLKDAIRDVGISVMWLTKSLFDFLFNSDETIFAALRYLLVGGEELDRNRILNLVHSKYSPLNLVNGYGPTENTTFSCTYHINREITQFSSVPIGTPLTNRTVYVLDDHLQPMPIGAVGELYVGGAGIAKGYLNRPELTCSRFIPNPFMTDAGTHSHYLYRTEDLVRWLPDGNLEYVGRKDFQVKLLGYRIELREIEALLSEYAGISQSVVLLKEQDGDKYLVAYYVASAVLDSTALRAHLAAHLPKYMIPSAFVYLKYLPLTTQGKLDKNALSQIEFNTDVTKNESIDESQYTVFEGTVHKIWSEALKQAHFSHNESFFNLGGNSLRLMYVKKIIEKTFNVHINSVDLFKYTTVKELSAYIENLCTDKNASTPFQTPIAHKEPSSFMANEPIAIVGMACRVPDANNVTSFWKMLINKQSSIRDVSSNDIRENQLPEILVKLDHYVKRSAVLEDSYYFDADFFGYSVKDAETIDPQQRHFLECAWEALEDSGNIPEKFEGDIGVFASQGKNYYFIDRLCSHPAMPEKTHEYPVMLGNEKDFLSTRVSYKLNLTGPSMTLQTGCSSSLVSIQTACENLKNYNCDMALAGGVSLFYNHGYLYQEDMIQSPDGYCRAFDQDANGTVAGSGVGIVVLKRLSDAIKNKDKVYAIIKGGAINNDGAAKMSYSAPSTQGQVRVLERAIKNANVTPDTITYVEAHGTGTPLGDPIEWAALHQVYSQYTDQNEYCTIGSLKTNIGHTDSAAGVLGLIKIVLAFQHQIIPATLNYKNLNPDIASFNKLFRVSNQPIDWRNQGKIRRAALSSFGMGGTNAHLILEEYLDEFNSEITMSEPDIFASSKQSSHETTECTAVMMRDFSFEKEQQLHVLIPFSAKNKISLRAMGFKIKSYIETYSDINVYNFAFTAQEGRAEFCEKAYFIVSTTITDRKNCIRVSSLNGMCAHNKNIVCPEIKYLDQIGQRWLCGEFITWQHARSPKIATQKIRIPTYEFDKKRYEIQKNSLMANVIPKRSKLCVETISEEDKLKKIWSDVLGVSTEELTNSSDFFGLGGDSMAYIDLLKEIKKVFCVNLNLENSIEIYEFHQMFSLIASLKSKQLEVAYDKQ